MKLFFFIREAILGIKRSIFMTTLTVVTITLSMLVFGVFLLVSFYLNDLSERLLEKLEMRVFLKSNLQHRDIQGLAMLLESHHRVSELKFIDKEASWLEFKSKYPQMGFDGFINLNPLPNMFVITVDRYSIMSNVAKEIKASSPFIEEVVYGGALAKKIESFSFFVRILGLFLVCVLTFATLMIVVNTIRLTIMVRENEIGIMSLVGATDAFIRAPFLIEGFILGMLGALFSSIILKGFYLFFSYRVQEHLLYMPTILGEGIFKQVYVILLVTGCFLGILGAYLSISKTLKSKQFVK